VTKQHPVSMVVNGRAREGLTVARRTLADFLREDLNLTGTHLGCEHGVCGTCTVLVNGEPVRSCLMFAVQADGAEVVTIEGLEIDGELAPLQEAMRASHSFQCGFCTPGFLMTVHALLREGAEMTENEWREELAGNLCRCTGYQSILEGVQLAAQQLRGDAAGSR
jgi:aerobic-type carbon monoxide dehydrogenase small subunit (CoxS/CutS family)